MAWPRFQRLRSRIIAFFVLFLVTVQLAAFFFVDAANNANARSRLETELLIGERVLERLLAQNREQLTQAARVLAADFGFREAVATRDEATILSALENHGSRVAADLVKLVDLAGRVVADTTSGQGIGQPFGFEELLEQARSEGSASGVVLIDGTVQQLVVVPVRAPLPVAWAAVGFAVDDTLADDLRELTGLDVTVLARRGNERWEVGASSLRAAASRQVSWERLAEERAVSHSVALDQEQYLARVLVLGMDSAGERILAVLKRSEASARVGFERLGQTLVTLGLLSVLVSAIGSGMIAAGITRPLGQLARDARRLAQGDYTREVAIDSHDEIGTLAGSLDRMRQDIGAREREILRLAYHDPLTELPNRARFAAVLRERLMSAAGGRHAVAVLAMDLDRFQHVNDTLGHAIGDEVLRAVAERLGASMPEDALLARLGGDEFACILPGVDTAGATTVANSILAAMETPFSVLGQPLDVGLSIGVASTPEHAGDAATLQRRADVAMHAAKQQRAGWRVYDPRHDTAREEHLTLLGELRRAVEHGELRLHYQPKLSLSDGRVHSVEALLRWDHPERGYVPPGSFIPFAEQTGYIKVLSAWVLEEAVRQASVWQASGLALRVSANLSARDLLVRDLADRVATLLERYRLAADRLCLEVTESGVMEDPEGALGVLTQLRELGVRLAIDDYGTGYSSLGYLMRLPVQELKIDRSFVSGLHESPQQATIVHSTIDLGHRLGFKVVAEGIEEEAELATLECLGCDEAQGYFVSKPLPAHALESWLGSRQGDCETPKRLHA